MPAPMPGPMMGPVMVPMPMALDPKADDGQMVSDLSDGLVPVYGPTPLYSRQGAATAEPEGGESDGVLGGPALRGADADALW